VGNDFPKISIIFRKFSGASAIGIFSEYFPEIFEGCLKQHANYTEKCENAALFVRLGLPSSLIRRENGAFRKRFSNRRNLKTPALRLRVDGKHFENGAFRKRQRHDAPVTFPPSLPKTQIQKNSDCCVFKFLRRRVEGKHFDAFSIQSETSVFKFLRRSVDGV